VESVTLPVNVASCANPAVGKASIALMTNKRLTTQQSTMRNIGPPRVETYGKKLKITAGVLDDDA
jgi:hypothetical protein